LSAGNYEQESGFHGIRSRFRSAIARNVFLLCMLGGWYMKWYQNVANCKPSHLQVKKICWIFVV